MLHALTLFALPLAVMSCTGPANPAPEAEFGGFFSMVVEGGPGGPETVELDFVGVSRFETDDFVVLAAEDQNQVSTVVIVLADFDGAGSYTPRKFFYRKGLQLISDSQAECVVEVADSGQVVQPWRAEFSCTGLLPEDDLGTDAEPWTITAGELYDGALTERVGRNSPFDTSAYRYDLRLNSASLGEGVLTADEDRAVVVPWQGGQTWVFFEDGDDASLDDLWLRLNPNVDTLLVDRWVRQQTSEDDSLELMLSAELSVTAAVEGGDAEATGEELSLMLWESVQEGEDDLVVNIR